MITAIDKLQKGENYMELTKCPKCGLPFRYGTEQVGVDNNNIPIYHRFGYCDTCRSKYDIDISSAQKYEEKKISDKKKSRKGWIILLILLFVFYAIGTSNNPDETADNESINQESKSDVINKKYLTEITWASLNNYCFAVETDTYDGDIVESGTYRFYPDLVVENSKKLPQVWDIYVSNNLYESLNMLQDSEYITTIGGFGKDEITIELKSGQYVYIKTIKMQGESTGLLKIKKQ